MQNSFNFSELDKAQQKGHLIIAFGRLIAPLDELAERTTPPTLADCTLAFAKVNAAQMTWYSMVHAFTTFGDVHFREIEAMLEDLPLNSGEASTFKYAITNDNGSSNLEDFHRHLRDLLVSTKAQFLRYIDRVPIDWQSTLYEANTPFTVYNRILDALANARQRVHYFDRYLSEDFFHLYLRNLDRSLVIRIVTTRDGVNAVKAVSALAKQEFSDYQLIEVNPKDMHGRALRVDDQNFTLDASAKDAGKYPTHFGAMDGSPNAHNILDNLIQNGIIIDQS